jgi:predicted nucleotidyltransferase
VGAGRSSAMIATMSHAEYARAWRERWAQEAEAARAAAEHAHKVARSLAARLREEYGVERVLLVGSLARGEFRPASDIDLTVTGLAPADLFRAGADLERMAEGFSVDLVPLESADPAFRRAADSEGIEL